MRDVEVVRLRARRGDLVAELVVRGALGGRDGVVVVAHADDLRDPGLDAVEAVDHGGLELHGVRLALDMRAVRGRGRASPRPGRPRPRAPNDSRISIVGADEILGGRALVDHLHLRLDDEAAVEAGQRRLQRERLDEHLHAPRRPSRSSRRSGCRRRAASCTASIERGASSFVLA